MSLTFGEVTTAGQTTVVPTPNPTDPPAPAGFALGDPPVYYEIQTDAVVTPPITVCIDYTETAFDNEALVQLRHFEPPNWVNITDSLDTANNIVCGDVTSFSLFATFEPADQCVEDPRNHRKCLVCLKKGKKQRTLSVKEDKLQFFLRKGATPGKCPRHDDDDDDDGRKNDDDDGRKHDDDDGRKHDDDDGKKRSSRKH